MTETRRFMIVAVWGALFCVGCNRQQTPAPPPPTPTSSAPPPTATPLNATPSTVATAPSQPATKAERPGRRTPPLPDAPESHRFEVGQDIPNAELVPATDPRSGALVSLVAPAPGLDSTFVTLVSPPPETGREGASSPRPSLTGAAPPGFTIIREAGFAAGGLPRKLRCEKDGSEMVLVPAGLFIQGRDRADEDAAPAHPVELSSYYIDVFEVTLRQYRMYSNQARPLPKKPANDGGNDDLPAVGVSWRDATNYLAWVGKELPTEAQWEKAARGPNQFLYPWGDGRVLWHRQRAPEQIDPVGSFPADRTLYGIYDMAGNAREWCIDQYSDDAYREAAGSTGAVAIDWPGPKRASKPGHRVVRGNAPDWQLWHRNESPALAPADDIGFRGVLRWPPASASAAGGRNSSQPPPTVTPGRQRNR